VTKYLASLAVLVHCIQPENKKLCQGSKAKAKPLNQKHQGWLVGKEVLRCCSHPSSHCILSAVSVAGSSTVKAENVKPELPTASSAPQAPQEPVQESQEASEPAQPEAAEAAEAG